MKCIKLNYTHTKMRNYSNKIERRETKKKNENKKKMKMKMRLT